MSISRRVAKNVLSLSAGEVIIRILGVGLSFYAALTLGPLAYGQLSVALAYMTFFNLFSDFGLSMLGIREIAQDRSKNNVIGTNILLIQAVLSAVLLLILALVLWLSGVDSNIFIIAMIFGCGMIPTSVNVAYLFAAHEKMEFQAIIKVVTQLVYVIIGFLVLVVVPSVFVLPLATLVSFIIGAALSLYLARRFIHFSLSRVDQAQIQSLLKQAIPFVIGGLMIQIYYSADSIILERFEGAEVVGYYSLAYRLPMLLFTFYWFFTSALFPLLSNTYHHDRPVFDRVVQVSQRIGGALAFPISIGGALLAYPLIALLPGNAYDASAPFFQILMLLPLIVFFNSNLGGFLIASGGQRLNTIAATAAAVINIVLNLLLIPHYGATAAAWATIAAEVMACAVLVYALRHDIHLRVYLSYLVRPGMAALVMGGVLLWLHAWPVLALIAVGALVYSICFVALGGIRTSDMHLLKNMLKFS